MTMLSEHDLWTSGRHRVASFEPGPDDLFVVGLLFGKRVFAWPITEYERAVRTAHQFARRLKQERPVKIMVLPMTADEFYAHIGTTREQLAAAGGSSPEEDAADRKLIIETCMSAVRESPDAAVRADALEVLSRMGVLS